MPLEVEPIIWFSFVTKESLGFTKHVDTRVIQLVVATFLRIMYTIDFTKERGVRGKQARLTLWMGRVQLLCRLIKYVGLVIDFVIEIPKSICQNFSLTLMTYTPKPCNLTNTQIITKTFGNRNTYLGVVALSPHTTPTMFWKNT